MWSTDNSLYKHESTAEINWMRCDFNKRHETPFGASINQQGHDSNILHLKNYAALTEKTLGKLMQFDFNTLFDFIGLIWGRSRAIYRMKTCNYKYT